MFDLFIAIVIGFLVGLLAKIITPGNIRAGFIVTSLLGIGGSVFATYLGRYLNFYASGEAAGFLGSVVGAIVLISVYKFVRNN